MVQGFGLARKPSVESLRFMVQGFGLVRKPSIQVLGFMVQDFGLGFGVLGLGLGCGV
jgi:hypothetical protein